MSPRWVVGPARLRRLIGVVPRGWAAAFAATCISVVAHADTTYFVDRGSTVCSDFGRGSAATPYCTIGAAVKKGAPGVTILVRPGVYPERITVPASGTPLSPFVIRALPEPDQPVVIEGADDWDDPGLWTEVAGGVWLASSVVVAPKQVFLDGARLAAWAGAADSLPSLAFAHEAGVGLYVHLGGSTPGALRLQVGMRTNGFRLNGRSWVTIDGFTVLRSEDKGIYVLGGSSEITLLDNEASFCRSNGIGVYGCSGVRIEANRTGDNADHGISLGLGTTRSLVRGNESYHNARPATRAATGIYLFGATANRVEANRLHDNQDSGIEMAQLADDNVSAQNRSWNNGDHGYDHIRASRNVHLGDVAYGNYKDGFSLEGFATENSLLNCIAVGNGLASGRYDLYVEPGSSLGLASDYNVFWNPTSQTPIKFSGVRYASVAAYAAASGQDAHSLGADPRFANPGAGDFHLSPGSPAIDAGGSESSLWPSFDAEGRVRVDDPAMPNTGAGPIAYADRGALEFHPEGDRPAVVDVPAALTVREGETLDLRVTASDPDGEPIRWLGADLSLLPAASSPEFIQFSDRRSGRLLWLPGYDEAGVYSVLFTVTSSAQAATGTTITVVNTDRPPAVVAPAQATAFVDTPLHLVVTASDPDLGAVTTLSADLSAFGPESGARFVPDASGGRGTLFWTARVAEKNTTVAVRFTAANALSGSATTAIRVVVPSGSGAGGRIQGARDPALSGPTPNPARGAASFTLDLPVADRVTWSVHDLQGRAFWSERADLTPGRHALRWECGEGSRGAAPAGVYFLRLRAESGLDVTRRFLLLP